ncbi:hypothetical protein JCM9957A_50280 [Kineosporia succinea]|uniref:Uncharacterized protein n=1 Tax=Kineosporia succinea TaxID=84632 RepID=A0ABT9PB15_9ACTN|nr:hypothetical protein [Kineosporia succinea]
MTATATRRKPRVAGHPKCPIGCPDCHLPIKGKTRRERDFFIGVHRGMHHGVR